MGFSLYEIDRQIEEQLAIIFDSVNDDGEITVSMDTLECLKLAKEEKIENIALYIKNLRAEAKAIKEEEETLTKRRRALDSKATKLEDYLMSHLDREEKFKTARCSIGFRLSHKVSIFDEDSIPSEFLRVKTEPDKTAISEALKQGKGVSGAEMVDNYSLQIK